MLPERAGKPKQQSSSLPLHEGIFPTYILFPRFHLGIENLLLSGNREFIYREERSQHEKLKFQIPTDFTA